MSSVREADIHAFSESEAVPDYGPRSSMKVGNALLKDSGSSSPSVLALVVPPSFSSASFTILPKNRIII